MSENVAFRAARKRDAAIVEKLLGLEAHAQACQLDDAHDYLKEEVAIIRKDLTDLRISIAEKGP